MPGGENSQSESGEEAEKTAELTEDHGAVYLEFIKRQLDDERQRFASLDNKGTSLISSSGTLVTLVLAIGALVTERTSFQPGVAFVILAVLALSLFVVAAVAGLLSNQTREYEVPAADTLDELWKVKKYWTQREPAARSTVIRWDINTIKTLRNINNKKAKWVTGGRIVQITATSTLAASAIVGLLS